MVFGVRVLSVCALTSLLGLATGALAQESDDPLRDTITDTAAENDGTPAPAQELVAPRLTIAEEEQPVEAARRPSAARTNPYDPIGISAGGLRLYPALEIGTVVSSNVRQSTTDRKAGVGLHVAPSLRLESDWVRHSLRSSLQGDYIAYAKNSEANTASVIADTRLRLDIRRTTTADLEFAYNLTPVRPDDTGLAGGAEGSRLDQTFTASTALTQDLGGVSLRLRTGLERQLYGKEDLDGGGSRDNEDLNNWKPSASLRVTYTDPPALQPFAEVGYARRFHDNKQNSSGQNTDSGDLDLRLGASFDDGSLWSGELALTYLRRDYRDSALDAVQTFGINGNLTWRPTDLSTVVLTASTGLDDTATDGRTYDLQLDFTHAMRDNISLRAGYGITLDKSSAGNDVTLAVGAGLEWQIAPELAWTAGYDATWFRGAGTANDYTEHRLTTGIVLRR